MKKVVFILLALFISCVVFADVVVDEGFENVVPPPDWSVVDNNAEGYVWMQSNTDFYSGSFSAFVEGSSCFGSESTTAYIRCGAPQKSVNVARPTTS